MIFSEAFRIVRLVNTDIPCIEPVPSGLILRPEQNNRPSDPAVIQCSVKVRKNLPEMEDYCTAYDGSPCPLGHSEDKLNSYRA